MSRYKLDKIADLSDDLVEDVLEMTGHFRKIKSLRGNFNIFYGFDFLCYYFVQLEPADEDTEQSMRNQDNDSDLLVDIDNRFDGLTGSDLGYFLRKVGAPYDHIENCFLDLPF